MRKTGLFALATLVMALAAVQTTRAQDDKRLADPDIEVEVGGLACPFCAYGIEKRFLKIDGVSQVVVLLKEGLVQVKMDDGVRVSEARVRDAVKEAGFETKQLKFLHAEVELKGTES